MSEVSAQTLEACLRRGVKEFVVCAGARNLPLVLAVIRCEGIKVWSHFEERSAAFLRLDVFVIRRLRLLLLLPVVLRWPS